MTSRTVPAPFNRVVGAATAFPDVRLETKYDASPVLRVRGTFVAGIATHPSAARDTLVVRCDVDQRELLLQDAPDAYYVTSFYEPYPVVLVRLAHVDDGALHDLLKTSRCLALEKSPRSSRKRPRPLARRTSD